MSDQIIITIGRKYGSGGRAVGKLLAEKLQIPFYDKELIYEAAKESGIDQEIIEENDEKNENLFLSYFVSADYPTEMPLNNKIFLAQFDAIKNLADRGSCVIVGRCADYVLRQYPNCINVFITAKLDDRIRMIKKEFNCSDKEAKEKIIKTEKNRTNYYEFYTGQKWDSVDNYHLCIDTSAVGVEGAAQTIMKYKELKIDRRLKNA